VAVSVSVTNFTGNFKASIQTDLTYFHGAYPVYFRLSQLQDLIAEQTEVGTSQQQLIYENHELSILVTDSQPVSSFPSTTSTSPIFLFKVTELAITMSALDTSDAVFSSSIRKAYYNIVHKDIFTENNLHQL